MLLTKYKAYANMYLVMKNKNLTNKPSLLHRHRVNKQVRAIKRAVLHNVELGMTDMPARGLMSLPFGKHEIRRGTIEQLNEKLAAYDVRVDGYRMKIRDTYVDRIAVTHLDKGVVEPSPAYQSALRMRFTYSAA